MAIKPTIYQVELEMVDLDRNYYEPHKLTLACHPSENEDRLMVRLMAFALNAHEHLEFGGGVSESEEPDLWQKSLTGDIELWIELGHPDEKVLVKAAGRAKKVLVYTYSASPDRWYGPLKARLAQLPKVRIISFDPDQVAALAALAERRMKLQVTIQDGTIWVRDDQGREVQLDPKPVEE